MRNGAVFIIYSFLFSLLLVGCSPKEQGTSFVFSGEATPQAPVIVSPTSLGSLTIYGPVVRITGCFNAECSANSKMSIKATGVGNLTVINTGFVFDATMTAGETRAFSFTASNLKGETSPAATLILFYDSTVMLTPLAGLFNGGTSGGKKTSGNYTLNFLTSLPSLSSSAITAGGYSLTSGALNPL